MTKFLIRRTLQAILVLFLVSVFTLALVQMTEPDSERQREQEAEQHLDAERDDAEFLNQLGEVTVITLGKGLWPLILGLPRIACTYHSRAATRS